MQRLFNHCSGATFVLQSLREMPELRVEREGQVVWILEACIFGFGGLRGGWESPSSSFLGKMPSTAEAVASNRNVSEETREADQQVCASCRVSTGVGNAFAGAVS